MTEGALVEAGTATQMALVQQLDPIYVDFTQSTSELARLREALASGQLQKLGPDAARVSIVLENGTVYKFPGKLLFTGITVDPSTGNVNLRAEVPNPDQVLLPGMYVRVRLDEGVDEKALLVPQQALQRTADGLQSLMVVKDGKVQQVAVRTGSTVNNQWIISSGLSAGDIVIVEGFQKIRPGAPVQTSPWDPNAKAGAAGQPGAKPADGQAPAKQEPKS